MDQSTASFTTSAAAVAPAQPGPSSAPPPPYSNATVAANGTSSAGPTKGTAGPLPTQSGGFLSRTQQKLMLQKDQLETQEASGPSAGSAAVKFAKEIERIDREFNTVVRFHDPLGLALERKRVVEELAAQAAAQAAASASITVRPQAGTAAQMRNGR
ncbi:hypothetical protein BCR44DRAFT_41493 [Catenaria anguillulae PL171]|uniref:Uncharacterized protein n=1 Tax=Catenaria anguillulae PL171 TaxID=765915 RepID=A0A1Y2HUA0_9FUNG|nr:hypothetical protein BCR44DRAFT_41493 [Catenaria anguillulae PL171]